MTCPSVPHVSIFISSLSLSLLSKFSKFSSRIYLDNNLLECFKLEGLCWKKSSWVNDPKNEYISEVDLSFSYILLKLLFKLPSLNISSISLLLLIII